MSIFYESSGWSSSKTLKWTHKQIVMPSNPGALLNKCSLICTGHIINKSILPIGSSMAIKSQLIAELYGAPFFAPCNKTVKVPTLHGLMLVCGQEIKKATDRHTSRVRNSLSQTATSLSSPPPSGCLLSSSKLQ